MIMDSNIFKKPVVKKIGGKHPASHLVMGDNRWMVFRDKTNKKRFFAVMLGEPYTSSEVLYKSPIPREGYVRVTEKEQLERLINATRISIPHLID